MTRERVLKILLLVLIGGALFAAGATMSWFFLKNTNQSFTVIRQQSGNYKFINPFLLLEVPESDSFPTYLPLKQALAKKVNDELAAHKATDISVYFRDLNSSHWVAVNPDDKFSAASMLKVVTLLAVLHAAESNPGLLSSKITIAPSDQPASVSQDYYPPQHPLQSGNTYTVQQLLAQLIIESDNAAGSVLYQLVGAGVMKQTYNDLRIPMPDPNADDAETTQEYSHLFRVLYSSTYLSPDLSEQVLDLLSRTEFTHGLVAGLPTGTVVAHKFGERSFAGPDTPHELHDCGIVYYPEHPYFVCIMTKGTDFPTLANVIADLSKVTWDEDHRVAQ